MGNRKRKGVRDYNLCKAYNYKPKLEKIYVKNITFTIPIGKEHT